MNTQSQSAYTLEKHITIGASGAAGAGPGFE
jgi:hypothetical protein